MFILLYKIRYFKTIKNCVLCTYNQILLCHIFLRTNIERQNSYALINYAFLRGYYTIQLVRVNLECRSGYFTIPIDEVGQYTIIQFEGSNFVRQNGEIAKNCRLRDYVIPTSKCVICGRSGVRPTSDHVDASSWALQVG